MAAPANSVWIGYFGAGQVTWDGSTVTFPGTVSATKYLAGDGTAGAPSYSFASEPGTGFYHTGADATSVLRLAMNGSLVGAWDVNGSYQFRTDVATLSFGASSDVSLSRGAAGQINSNSSLARTGSNGQLFHDLQSLTELTTIAAAATTDTTIQMPANAVVLGVSVRVTVVIPTAATFTVGDSGSAARFSTAAVSSAANSTDSGTKAGAYYNASALSVRITPNLTPAANTGRVRVTIYYFSITPPTS